MDDRRAAATSSISLRAERSLQVLGEAFRLFWSAADSLARRRLSLAFALVVSSGLLAALTPIALKLVVDSLAADGQSRDAATMLIAPAVLVAMYVVGQYLTRVLTELRTFVHGHLDQRIRRRIGRRMFEHLVRLPLRFHLERKTGAMGETAEQGIRGYQLLLTHTIYTILPVTIEFLTVAIVLIQFGHTQYFAILGVASVAYVVAFYHGAKAVKESSGTASKAHIEAHAVLTDTLLNHETVKYFDAEPVVCTRYDAALSRTESAWRRFYTRRALNGIIVATIFAGSLGTSLFFAVSDVMRGAMTVGDFVLVNTYVVRLVQPLELLGAAVRDVAQGIAFLRGMLDLFREKAEGDSSSSSLPRPSAARGGAEKSLPDANAIRGELRFDHVSFSYGHERPILKDVSFVIPAGRTLAVVGVSGSGKSSLIRLLFRLYEPNSGRILLDGSPIAEMPLSTVRQAIAVVPQDTVLFHDTIANNIGFGRYGASMTEIEAAARIAHLHDFIANAPDGYETMVGERGLKLSGGERQRVAIARAALKRPRIFVFDEATSSLDTRTEREILRNLLDVSAHSTTLVIAHRLSTVVHADEILVLDRGVVLDRGTHDELLARNGSYAALWNSQQGTSGKGGFASATRVLK
jgi:ABC-type transport system involved in Fe-S cluster assembly fused permease/ATPase subunit